MNKLNEDITPFLVFARTISRYIALEYTVTRKSVKESMKAGHFFGAMQGEMGPFTLFGPSGIEEVKFFNEAFRQVLTKRADYFNDTETESEHGLHWVLEGCLFAIEDIVSQATYRSKDDIHKENKAALERLIADKRIVIDSDVSEDIESEEPSESDMWEHDYEYNERHD